MCVVCHLKEVCMVAFVGSVLILKHLNEQMACSFA